MSAKFKDYLEKLADEQVILTFATSIDGIIGKRDGILAISSSESLILTHTIRNYSDAILIGIGTVLNDNPSLTTRLISDPIDARVVVVDPFLKCPEDAKFMHRKPILLVSCDCDAERIVKFANLGALVVKITTQPGTNRLDLNACIKELLKLGFQKIMIEGYHILNIRRCRDYQRMFEWTRKSRSRNRDNCAYFH